MSKLPKYYVYKTEHKETKTKQSAANTGENHPMHGKTHTEEAKAKISAANIGKTGELCPNTGRKHTEEHKAKNSAAKQGENSHNAKLTESEVILIRELWATGDYTQKELALKFGVKKTTISKIILRQTWKHIPPSQ